MSNDLNVTDGSLTTASDFDDVTIGSDGTLVLSDDATVSGNWANSGTFIHNNNTVTFDGTAAGKTIASGGQAFYNRTVDGTGGAWTTTDALTVSSDLNVTQGTLTVSGATTTGVTTINGGTPKLGASNVLADATSVTVNAGGTFDLNDKNETISSLTLVGTGAVDDASAASNTLTHAATGDRFDAARRG